MPGRLPSEVARPCHHGRRGIVEGADPWLFEDHNGEHCYRVALVDGRCELSFRGGPWVPVDASSIAAPWRDLATEADGHVADLSVLDDRCAAMPERPREMASIDLLRRHIAVLQSYLRRLARPFYLPGAATDREAQTLERRIFRVGLALGHCQLSTRVWMSILDAVDSSVEAWCGGGNEGEARADTHGRRKGTVAASSAAVNSRRNADAGLVPCDAEDASVIAGSVVGCFNAEWPEYAGALRLDDAARLVRCWRRRPGPAGPDGKKWDIVREVLTRVSKRCPIDAPSPLPLPPTAATLDKEWDRWRAFRDG